MIMSRPDPFRCRIGAHERRALHPHVQEQGLRHQGGGGAVFSDGASTRALIEQVAILHQVGIKTVLVHGGGPQLDSVQATLGIETRMVNGRRVTDQKSIDVTSMVLNGLINTRILAICRELGIEAIACRGSTRASYAHTAAQPVPISEGSSETVDYGFVGDIDSVNAVVLEKLLEDGLMPVVSPLSADGSGNFAEHQCRHRGRGHWRCAVRGKARAVHRRAGHSRTGRGSQHGDFPIPTSRVCSGCAMRAASRTACCPRPPPSRAPSAAACGACTSSPTSPRTASSRKYSPTKEPALWWWRTSRR